MKISCIIPTKNRCCMVLEAIESVRAQQCQNLEIVVVDDGSTDDTLAAINGAFPEVHTIRRNGLGPGQARNTGATAASGDVLMFLDSDDLWLANHVSNLVNVMNRGFQVAYGVAQTMDEVGGSTFLIPEDGSGPEGDCFAALVRWCFFVPSAMAVTRAAFTEIGGFDASPYGEDWTFFLRLGARLPLGFAGPEPITMRRLHRGSLCFLHDRKKLLAIIRQVLKLLENEPRATPAQRGHFTMLHEWTAKNVGEWSTVQDWYQAMRKEKII